tara:strand:- start:278 stop:493 length:216 start_codon:yes stop_codon:yes gene_type:complete
MDNIPTSEFSLSTKFLDDILYSIKSGLTVQFNSELKVKNNDLLSSMPLNQYNSLVKQLDEREKYLKQQGIL